MNKKVPIIVAFAILFAAIAIYLNSTSKAVTKSQKAVVIADSEKSKAGDVGKQSVKEQVNVKDMDSDQKESNASPLVIYGYDINLPIKELDRKQIKTQVEDLERAVEYNDLIGRINNGMASPEEAEQSAKVFARLSKLRMAEVQYMIEDLDQDFAAYEEEHKERLEAFRAKKKEEQTESDEITALDILE
ncbi:hypothetical protein [Zooshikella harenae]|uniref:Uncharacterized protein n=1 Tax=Zooshikella harenae TaxID=2827238 RepID=A0ABS5ZFP3_9GAMM|nr:hypothetical protein [Zooshikella harenae]MBU2712869.1 hypothetical protein [Zooshikella harenae]